MKVSLLAFKKYTQVQQEKSLVKVSNYFSPESDETTNGPQS